MLAPGSLGRTARDAVGEVGNECAKAVDLGQSLGEPLGRIAVLVGALCIGVAVGLEAIGPLFAAADDAGLSGEAIPRGSAPWELFARRLREATVGREGDHGRALEVTAEQVEQGKRAPAE